MSVQGDGGQGVRGHVDGHHEREVDHVAQRLPERPVVHHVPHDVEGDVETSDQQVGHGQIGQKEVGGRVQALVLQDHVAHERVAEDGDDGEDGVGEDEQRVLQRLPVSSGPAPRAVPRTVAGSRVVSEDVHYPVQEVVPVPRAVVQQLLIVFQKVTHFILQIPRHRCYNLHINNTR